MNFKCFEDKKTGEVFISIKDAKKILKQSLKLYKKAVREEGEYAINELDGDVRGTRFCIDSMVKSAKKYMDGVCVFLDDLEKE